jgi:hypothetical protein
MTFQDRCPAGTTSSQESSRHDPPWTSAHLRRIERRSLPPSPDEDSARAWLCVGLFSSHRSEDHPTRARAPCVPLRRLSQQRPLPAGHRSALPSAVRSHPHRRVPSTGVLTTSTACSAAGPAGLLHPASDPGVRPVSARVATRPLHRGGPTGPSDTRFPGAHTPCEGFPPVDTVALSPALRPPLPSIGKRPSHTSTATFQCLCAHERSTPRPDCEGLTPTGSVDRITRFPR